MITKKSCNTTQRHQFLRETELELNLFDCRAHWIVFRLSQQYIFVRAEGAVWKRSEILAQNSQSNIMKTKIEITLMCSRMWLVLSILAIWSLLLLFDVQRFRSSRPTMCWCLPGKVFGNKKLLGNFAIVTNAW